MAIFLGTLALIPIMGFDMFPDMDQGEANINIELPSGSPITQTTKIVNQVVELVEEVPELESWYVQAGESSTDQATVTLNLVDKEERSRSTEDVVNALKEDLAGIAGAEITASASTSAMGAFDMGAGIQVQITGSEMDTLREVSEEVTALLNEQPWITEITSSMQDSVPQANIRINRDKASAYGITAGSIASAVSLSVTGNVSTQYKVDGEEIDVRIMEDPDSLRDINDLESVTVTSAAGFQVPLSEIAEISIEDSSVEILRTNQQRYVTLEGDFVGMDASSAKNKISQILDNYDFPEGYGYQFSGSLEMLTDTFYNLILVLIVAVLLVYMIMAAQFESFLYPMIIMFSLPLALTGGILGLFLTGDSLTTPSFMGLIMLVGMVVNNAIVLVDYTNQLVKKGLSCDEALIEAGSTRLRPILMTTLTTVLGLIPMALTVAEGTEMQRPLAISVMSGLLLSTLITLIFIPVLYSWVEKFRTKGRKRQRRQRYTEGDHGEAQLQEEVNLYETWMQ